jgi:hypothetical protein
VVIPLFALILGSAALGALAVVVLIVLFWKEIVAWFKNRSNLVEEDTENLAFTLQSKLKSGDYKTVQGIFNKRTADVVEGRKIESKEVDEKLHEYHQRNELVLYE